MVVLVAMIPSRPSSVARSAIASMSLSAKSGAILTSSGTRRVLPGSRPSRGNVIWLPGRPAGNVIEGRAHRGQQRPQRRDRLKVPQAGRVRRADVDHHVVGHPGHQPGAGYVVRDRLVRGSGPGLADVHPDDDRTSPTPGQRAPPPARPTGPASPPAPPATWVTRAPATAAPPQLLSRGRRTRVVEAHPVHHRPVRGQPEHPRPRVIRLRLRRHRTDLNEREAKRAERVRAAGVLVETGGQPQRPGQVSPSARTRRTGYRGASQCHSDQAPPTRTRRADQPEPGRVRGLGRKPPQQHPVHQLIHGSMVAPRAMWGLPGLEEAVMAVRSERLEVPGHRGAERNPPSRRRAGRKSGHRRLRVFHHRDPHPSVTQPARGELGKRRSGAPVLGVRIDGKASRSPR